MKRYIKKGKKKYKPTFKTNFSLRSKSVEKDSIKLEVPQSVWFDPVKNGGKNYWLKAGGRTYGHPFKWGVNGHSLKNDEFATMLGWRPKENSPGIFEAVCYTNYEGISYAEDDDHKILEFSCLEEGGFVKLIIETTADQVKYLLETNKGKEVVIHPFGKLRLTWNISPWHGGEVAATKNHYIISSLTN
jgi:hypothetical protein